MLLARILLIGSAVIAFASSASGQIYTAYRWDEPVNGSWTNADAWRCWVYPDRYPYDDLSAAVFDLNSDGYRVTLPTHETIGFLNVQGDTVTLKVTGSLTTTAVGCGVGMSSGEESMLTLTGGGTFFAEAGMSLGHGMGSRGTVLVKNGKLKADTWLTVGESGQGLLMAEADGQIVSEQDTTVGETATGSGALVIAEGSYRSKAGLYVSSADGMWIRQGGTATVDGVCSLGVIGPGGAKLEDAGTTMTVGGLLRVGSSNHGSLDVLDGAALTVTNEAVVGSTAGFLGTMTVQDATFHANRAITVGQAGEAQLTVDSGAAVTGGGDFLLGHQASGDGTVDIDGSDTTFAVNRRLWTGYGNGLMRIKNGATVDVGGSISLGQEAGGDGKIVLRHANSSLTVAEDIELGTSGDGTLIVREGATLSARKLLMGLYDHAFGTLTVDDADVTLSGLFEIGAGGAHNGADVTISNGGQVICGGQAIMWPRGTLHLESDGRLSASKIDFAGGEFDWTGGTLEITGEDGVTVGPGKQLENANVGAGKSLFVNDRTIVESGGLLELSGGEIRTWGLNASAGKFDFSAGTLQITGGWGFSIGPSRWMRNLTLASDMALAVDHELTVQNNGTIELDGGQLGCNALALEGGTLRSTNGLNLNLDGIASTTVTLNGQIESGANLLIGGASGQDVAVDIRKGSLTADAMTVGNNGQGTLRLGSMGSAVVDSVAIGDATSSLGQLKIEGGDFTCDGALVVGRKGQGTLNVKGEATLTSGSGKIAQRNGSTGTAIVNGATWSLDHGLFVGGDSNSPGGTGTLTLLNNADVNVAETLKLWPGGMLDFQGGSLTTRSLDATQGTFNWTGGTLSLTGNAGLTVGPNGQCDNLVVGMGQALSVAGELTLATGGSLKMTGGDLSAEQIDINGGTLILTQPMVLTSEITNHGLLLAEDGLELIDATLNLGSTGTVQVQGALAVRGQSELAVDISGSLGGSISSSTVDLEEGSQLRLNATARLADVGESTRTLLDAEQFHGTFSEQPLPGSHLGYGLFIEALHQDDTTLNVDLFQAGFGDVDGDRNVGIMDIFTIKRSEKGFGTGATDATWLDGDMVGIGPNTPANGIVDLWDIFAIKQAGLFGAGTYASVAQVSQTTSPVPEPSTWMLLFSAIAGLLCLRRCVGT